MGTNFYLRKKFDSQDQRKLLEDIRYGRYNEAEEMICFKVHIGKRSAGWKFLWNANNFKYFKQSKTSLFEFLKTGRIFDEYGKEFTFDQFINDEIAGFLDNGYDIDSYENSEKSRGYSNTYYFYEQDRYRKFKETFGVDVNKYGEFYIDGLRFTVCDDFS